MLDDFTTFLMRGNVIDLAMAVIIGFALFMVIRLIAAAEDRRIEGETEDESPPPATRRCCSPRSGIC